MSYSSYNKHTTMIITVHRRSHTVITGTLRFETLGKLYKTVPTNMFAFIRRVYLLGGIQYLNLSTLKISINTLVQK